MLSGIDWDILEFSVNLKNNVIVVCLKIESDFGIECVCIHVSNFCEWTIYYFCLLTSN